jgi:hypothetical protein
VAEWHPIRTAKAVEWTMTSTEARPYASIRLIEVHTTRVSTEPWYRAVTYAKSSEDRELIGWCRTLGAAAAAACDYHLAFSAWRHYLVARRDHEYPGGMPTPPRAFELLLAYRRARQEERDRGRARTHA